jgi:hypothetical protein
MENGDEISLSELKKLFRILSKQVHPDTSNKTDELFIELRRQYEEAYNYIINSKSELHVELSREEARIELLKRLYHFYLSIYSKRSYQILDEMIKYAKKYDNIVYQLLLKYKNDMYMNLEEWKRNHRIFYAHNVVITGIMQFFECYNKKGKVAKELSRKIYLGHKQSIEMWIGNCNDNYKTILLSIHDWLKEELNKPSFEYYGI